ncbi:unnamed protein product [Strongylus vulgaris]|uniref:Flavin-containing monooxygenase n=1 Tax=Strongylus vulgaris TaxID=40348 RepID=A0A3P7JPC3_STRVU|nr:unnamed protein product [Strongylus vulgaris]
MPISEMQARVFYENLVGQRKIPGSEEMKKSIKEKRQAMEIRYVNSPRHTIQVDFISYMDELADLVGCKPDMKELFLSDPFLALQATSSAPYPTNYERYTYIAVALLTIFLLLFIF